MNKPTILTSLIRACKQYTNNFSNPRCYSCIVHHAAFRKVGFILPELRLQFQKPVIQQCTRNYAKSKNIRKEKGKTKVQINESQLAEIVNVESVKNQMQKGIETLKTDFVKSLSIRSAAGSIESLVVNVDGTDHTLQELAQIVRKNPKLVVVNMAVFPQAIPAALKAISDSGMNLNPQQEGTTLYIQIPKVTKDHRETLSKNAKALFVKCKDSIRDVQVKTIRSLKKKDGVATDTVRQAEQQIIALADSYINEAEKILASKQTELVGKD